MILLKCHCYFTRNKCIKILFTLWNFYLIDISNLLIHYFKKSNITDYASRRKSAKLISDDSNVQIKKACHNK